MSRCICGHTEDDHDHKTGECEECDCEEYEPDQEARELIFD